MTVFLKLSTMLLMLSMVEYVYTILCPTGPDENFGSGPNAGLSCWRNIAPPVNSNFVFVQPKTGSIVSKYFMAEGWIAAYPFSSIL